MGSLFESDAQTSTNNPYQADQFDNLLSSADAWLAAGGMGEADSYYKDLQGILGQMGSGYMDMLSGAGKEDRYKALQDLNAASAAQAGNALEGSLSSIGLGAGGTGTANSSRRGVAEGVATAQANRDLSSMQAAQNQQFLQNEQALQQAGLQGMGGLYGLTGQLHQMAQGESAGAKQLQDLLAYQGLISGSMGGTTTTTGGGPSLGSQIIGGAASGIGAFLSDKRLKKKVKKIKTKEGKQVKTKDGIDAVEWEWNDKAEKEYGVSGKARGVLAQDAEKKRPDAVKTNSKGTKMVQYGKLM